MNKRKEDRHIIKTKLSFCAGDKNTELKMGIYNLKATTQNISRNGMCVFLPIYLPPNNLLRIFLHSKEKEMIVLSKIRYCKRLSLNIYKTGIEFLNLTKINKQTVENILKRRIK